MKEETLPKSKRQEAVENYDHPHSEGTWNTENIKIQYITILKRYKLSPG